jgi:two-component SAPR family response regulator
MTEGRPRNRILVLDDEFLVAMSLSSDLERGGYTVIGPCNGASEAMALVEKDRPDGAFLDVNLGRGRNSFELARELKRLDIPFLFVTGYSESMPMRDEFPEATFLSKPIGPDRAVEAADRLVNAN